MSTVRDSMNRRPAYGLDAICAAALADPGAQNPGSEEAAQFTRRLYERVADRDLLAIALVEDPEVIAGLPALLERAPVDVVLPGAGDLSGGLGMMALRADSLDDPDNADIEPDDSRFGGNLGAGVMAYFPAEDALFLPMVTGQAGRKALELATRVHEAMAGR
mgnify:CR=1 FL=1